MITMQDLRSESFKLLCVWLIFLELLLLSSEISTSAVESLPRYIGVDEKDDVQLFYYFIPSEGNPHDDPLVLWLTGGPGCSALSGLVYEIGPLRFNKTKYDGRLPTLLLNPYSWTKVSSIIFLDAPVGTGFSYSTSAKGYDTGDKVHAHQSRIFLEKWLLSHPSFIENDVYIAGDSYSGKVVPLIAREILEASNNILQGPPINLKVKVSGTISISHLGYLLGNPVTDSVFDEGSMIPFAYHKALIPKELYKSAKRNCRGEYVLFNRTRFDCAEDLRTISECISRVNKGHILEPKCDMYKPSSPKLLGSRRYMAETYEDTWRASRPPFYCRIYKGILERFHFCDGEGEHLRTRDWSFQVQWDVKKWHLQGGGHTAPEYLPKECFAMYRRWIYQEPL